MIEQLYVHNFRCLENFTLDLNGHHSALLIGKNGAGKSTVINALRVFQAICRGPNRAKDVVRTSDFTRLDKSRRMRLELKFRLRDRRFQYAVALDWPMEFKEAQIAEESLTVEDQPVFRREKARVSVAAGAEFGLDWHVFALPVISERPSEHSISDAKAYLASLILIEPIPRLGKGFSEEPAAGLDQEAWNFASCLRHLLQKKPKAYGKFEEFAKQVIPDFSSIENEDRGNEGASQLVVTFERPDPFASMKLDYDLLSNGEKCLLLSAYINAAQAVAGPNDPPSVCVWDEPDSHLAISEVGHFILELRRMTGHTGQFIATSHHPETIRKFSGENTFVLTRKSHFEPSTISTLSSIPYGGDPVNALIRDEIIG